MDKVAQMPPLSGKQRSVIDLDLYGAFYTSVDELLAAEPSGFAAVMAGSENGVELADALSARFGVRGNDPSSSTLRRSKWAMQLRLQERGLSCIQTKVLDQREISDEGVFASSNGYVLKPVDAAGAENVIFCRNIGDLSCKLSSLPWQSYSTTWTRMSSFLLQEYIPGPEYVVDLVAAESSFVVTSVCCYTKLSDCGVSGRPFVKLYSTTLDPSDDRLRHIVAYAKAAASALEIVNGPAHIEIIDGPAGPVLIDVGARLHGTGAPRWFQACYRNDLLDSVYKCYFANGRGMRNAELAQPGIKSYVAAERAGYFGGLSPDDNDRLAAVSSMLFYQILVEDCAEYKPTIDLLTTSAHGYFACSDDEVLRADVTEFEDTMSLHFGEGLKSKVALDVAMSQITQRRAYISRNGD